MGNQLTCMVSSRSIKKSHTKSRDSPRRAKLEQELEQQALAFALYQQQQKSRVGRAASHRFSDTQQHKRSISRSSRSLTDLDFRSNEFLAKERSDISALESKHFVLVHGGGYGAWCWYKSIALLEECGFAATAVDLTGSGIESTDPNTIASLSHYSQPLSDFLENLPVDEKVILVGHDFGGACVSYAMENNPTKICKAVFVAAAMPSNAERALDVFAPEVFTYANGQSSSPTALSFHKSTVKELFFNRSPAKDVALASVSLKPVPFAPVLEKLQLSKERYGSVRRFYVQTMEDSAMTPALQERLLSLNPPERVFKIKGSDHSPFFSKPQSLHKVLAEIAQI